LTIDLSADERRKLIARDETMLQRAAYHEIHTDNFIAEVEFLHFTGNMDVDTIAEFYLLHQTKVNIEDKAELLDYINRIIEHKK